MYREEKTECFSIGLMGRLSELVKQSWRKLFPRDECDHERQNGKRDVLNPLTDVG